MDPQPCVLLKYGEIALKGRNRGWFESHLLRSVEHAFSGSGDEVRIRWRQGVLAVSCPALSPEELAERARTVIGIRVVQPGLRVNKTPEAAASAAVSLLRERCERLGLQRPSFAIRARRRHKRFPMNSDKLASFVGAQVCADLDLPVNLNHPNVEVEVEVDRHEVFVSADKQRGQGGLPVGSSGHVVVLLSGGYDSPVAAYRAMRRGLRCEFVHFTGAPYTGPSSTYKAYALVRELSRFQPEVSLHTVPVGNAQRALAVSGAGEAQIVAQRRLFVRAAETLAKRLGAEALVTGDSLGQVSSQTLSNMGTIDNACSLPILRPLVGWDKEEIMTEAGRIGTGEISKLPDEDCCTLILPPTVATHTTPEQLSKIEGRVALDELVDKLLAEVQLLRPGQADPVASCAR
ncbi:tRNA uracil 4-sulfurtransferase ThiI [Haloechinothrix sp. LS1_15]|uniref:tRNA uracil 4-sulfurtransferase ThiI n=1 Tax=Haloechinothrix sp. LS1_15 TaxID=2652248 RepID=UPI002945154C|nr:tRNA uracil 4-sulfurtransferase ThiI [Haloechinothrix sp. LS1_15]MDV6014206.1 tRNA 4-thiouridine(8) synthase ThiI [Haloechinothrix sp. LS1_15]